MRIEKGIVQKASARLKMGFVYKDIKTSVIIVDELEEVIIKIYDRYTNELYNIIEIKGLTREKLKEIHKEFKTYLHNALQSDTPLDADNEELFAFIESKGYKIKHIVIDEEIDL